MEFTDKHFVPFSSTYVDFEQQTQKNAPTFGVLHLNVNKFPNTVKALDLNFQIDNSGSMVFLCADGGKKQEHVNFTADRMMRYLQINNINATVSVSSFDDHLVTIVDPQQLTQHNVEEISYKINQIKPRGSTNIASVLENGVAWSKKSLHPTKEQILFLFTDGQATCGKTTNREDLIQISQKISPETTVVAIGCGTDYDFELLKGIANRKKGVNKFIGNVEEVSFACGEILDGIINKIIENCEICVLNGEIWDWKRNAWARKITINNIVGECDKTYHVKSSSVETFRAIFTGTVVESGAPFECIITQIHENQDVRKHKFRHATLNLLHETTTKGTNPDVYTSHECVKDLKRKLKDFTVKIKAFMDENDLRDDPFMKTLCSDIFVCYSSIGTQYGHMYTSSRQTSQATQGIHTNMCDLRENIINSSFKTLPVCSRQMTQAISIMQSDLDAESNILPIMHRNPSNVKYWSMTSNDDDDDIGESQEEKEEREERESDEIMFNHQPISNHDSPYANIKTMGVIRSVSMGSNV
jgi:hypothetical protein